MCNDAKYDIIKCHSPSKINIKVKVLHQKNDTLLAVF